MCFPVFVKKRQLIFKWISSAGVYPNTPTAHAVRIEWYSTERGTTFQVLHNSQLWMVWVQYAWVIVMLKAYRTIKLKDQSSLKHQRRVKVLDTFAHRTGELRDEAEAQQIWMWSTTNACKWPLHVCAPDWWFLSHHMGRFTFCSYCSQLLFFFLMNWLYAEKAAFQTCFISPSICANRVWLVYTELLNNG